MSSAIVPSSYDELVKLATALAQSGFFPESNKPAQAIAKVLAGREMGIPPFAAMTGIHIMQGKAIVGANLMATMLENHPKYDYRVDTLTDTECKLTFFRDGNEVGESVFTIKEAQAAGLANKQVWKNYPKNMLFARAISNGVKWFTPGVFGGAAVYTPEEFDLDTDEEGYISAKVTDLGTYDPFPEQEVLDGFAEPLPLTDDWDFDESVEALHRTTGTTPKAPTITITLEAATSVLDSKGVPYAKMSKDELSRKSVWIDQAIKAAKKKNDPDHLANLQIKREAVGFILKNYDAVQEYLEQESA